MKKVLFLTIVFTLFACTSFGQFKLSLGPLVGMNYNFYHGPTISASNMSFNGIGLAVGGQLDMSFNPVLGLQVTVLPYDGMSASGTSVQSGVKSVSEVSLAYLTINPSLKFMIPETGLGFFAGPGLGFKLTGAIDQYQITNGVRQQNTQTTDFQNVNPRFSGQIGMCYDFDLNGVRLSPYILLDYGFIDVIQQGDWKASGVKFGLVCKFDLVDRAKQYRQENDYQRQYQYQQRYQQQQYQQPRRQQQPYRQQQYQQQQQPYRQQQYQQQQQSYNQQQYQEQPNNQQQYQQQPKKKQPSNTKQQVDWQPYR